MTFSPVPPNVLQDLSEKSRSCVERLRLHELKNVPPDLSAQPKTRLAAVLVLLYERAGELRVLLTTRSKLLRSHPGQTALPGGKMDDCDADLIATAYREAHEEVALPLNCPYVHNICQLEPFFFAPEILNASDGEVAQIFDHPLEAVLDPTLSRNETLVAMGSEYWPHEVEFHSTSDSIVSSLGNLAYRMHRFRSSASPIKGLTSDILIMTAEITYGRTPSYERYAPGQATDFGSIHRVLMGFNHWST